MIENGNLYQKATKTYSQHEKKKNVFTSLFRELLNCLPARQSLFCEPTIVLWPEMIITPEGTYTQLEMDPSFTAVAAFVRGILTKWTMVSPSTPTTELQQYTHFYLSPMLMYAYGARVHRASCGIAASNHRQTIFWMSYGIQIPYIFFDLCDSPETTRRALVRAPALFCCCVVWSYQSFQFVLPMHKCTPVNKWTHETLVQHNLPLLRLSQSISPAVQLVKPRSPNIVVWHLYTAAVC